MKLPQERSGKNSTLYSQPQKILRAQPRALRRARLLFSEQQVHVQAVPEIGGDPAGGGVRMHEKAELLQGRHLVADRGRAHPRAEALGDPLRSHGLGLVDVGVDHRFEDLLLARVQVEHGPHLLALRCAEC